MNSFFDQWISNKQQICDLQLLLNDTKMFPVKKFIAKKGSVLYMTYFPDRRKYRYKLGEKIVSRDKYILIVIE